MSEHMIEIWWGGDSYSVPSERTCTKCGTTKESHEFYFRDGHPSARCKECDRKQQKEAYHNRRNMDVEHHISRIGEMAKPQRINAVLAMFKSGQLNVTQTRTILKRIEF